MQTPIPVTPKVSAARRGPRPNQERTQATQAALIAAARQLFVAKGYADTGTPEIVGAAQVTRGALYHHWADKADLFFAVALQAADEVAAAVGQGGMAGATPLDRLLAGAEAYFAAMADAGRARLLLLDAPAVLSAERVRQLSERAGAAELAQGLRELLAAPARPLAALPGEAELAALAAQLSAAFDRAALAVARGEPGGAQRQALRRLLTGLAAGSGAAGG
ncbi:MAG: TetR/AcrR family transcriptional regulator [Proteobacteria bacterium]|nr:TetR/AcrR family transcriptional regulator [Pseudomonadota bacterium]